MCRGGPYSIRWIFPLYPWPLPYNAECQARRDQVPFFESLVWLDLGLNPSLPNHWRRLYLCPISRVRALIFTPFIFRFDFFIKHKRSNIIKDRTLFFIKHKKSNSEEKKRFKSNIKTNSVVINFTHLKRKLIWFGLVLFFYGLSNVAGYLMPKPFL